jgi:hypothetical protein
VTLIILEIAAVISLALAFYPHDDSTGKYFCIDVYPNILLEGV